MDNRWNFMFVKRSQLKKYASSGLAHIGRYLLLIGLSYVLIYPFAFMIINSFKDSVNWFDPSVIWIPKSITFDNYTVAIKYMDYFKSLLNTLFSSIFPALFSFFTCAIAGYGLARFEFKGKKILTFIMILCILLPDPLLMIPSYDNYMHLDFLGIFKTIYNVTGVDLRISIIDTPFVFILPAIFSSGLKNGLFIYIYNQFFKGLPKELEEAAWIDGAGPWQTFFRVVLPSSGASSITVLVFSIVWYWNDYYQSQIYYSENFPISAMLAQYNSRTTALTEYATQYSFSKATLLLTCCLITILPVMIFYLFMQRKFVQSIATSGIVG